MKEKVTLKTKPIIKLHTLALSTEESHNQKHEKIEIKVKGDEHK